MSWSLAELDPTEDFEIFDGKETIYYAQFDAETDSYGTEVKMCALARESVREMVVLQSGETTNVDLVFHIRKDALDFLPRRLDRIRISADYDRDGIDETTEYYTVQGVRWQTFGTRCRLSCTKQVSA